MSARRLQVVYRRANVGAAAIHAPTASVIFTSKDPNAKQGLLKMAKQISAEGVIVTNDDGRVEWIAPACVDRIEDLGEKTE